MWGKSHRQSASIRSPSVPRSAMSVIGIGGIAIVALAQLIEAISLEPGMVGQACRFGLLKRRRMVELCWIKFAQSAILDSQQCVRCGAEHTASSIA